MSLLPGLRDLRTPLAVGYLWLAVGWLLFGDKIPIREDSTGPLASAYKLGEVLGVGGSLGIITFLAFVLGSVLSLQYLVSGVQAPWEGRARDPRAVLSGNAVRRSGMGFVGESTFRAMENHIRKRISHAVKTGRHDRDGIARIVNLPAGSAEHALIVGLYFRLKGELNELVTKLALHDKDRLWETYDRKSAEAEFRQATAVPLLVLIAVAGAIGSNWIWVASVVPVIFLVQGLRRGQEARSEVYQAVIQGIIRSYVLDLVGDVPDESDGDSNREERPAQAPAAVRPHG